jgi:hypothetical protein
MLTLPIAAQLRARWQVRFVEAQSPCRSDLESLSDHHLSGDKRASRLWASETNSMSTGAPNSRERSSNGTQRCCVSAGLFLTAVSLRNWGRMLAGQLSGSRTDRRRSGTTHLHM